MINVRELLVFHVQWHTWLKNNISSAMKIEGQTLDERHVIRYERLVDELGKHWFRKTSRPYRSVIEQVCHVLSLRKDDRNSKKTRNVNDWLVLVRDLSIICVYCFLSDRLFFAMDNDVCLIRNESKGTDHWHARETSVKSSHSFPQTKWQSNASPTLKSSRKSDWSNASDWWKVEELDEGICTENVSYVDHIRSTSLVSRHWWTLMHGKASILLQSSDFERSKSQWPFSWR